MTDGQKTGLGMILAAIVSVAIAYVPNREFARSSVDTKIASPEFQSTLHEMASTEVRRALAENASIPRGTIIAWYMKSGQIPAGWAICDGANDTPNLVGKYLLGAENLGTNLTAIGSGKGHVVIPAHTHELAIGQMTRQTLGTQREALTRFQETKEPNHPNAFTDPGGAADVELSQLPLSMKVVFLIKL
jgi:hypothetical protein